MGADKVVPSPDKPLSQTPGLAAGMPPQPQPQILDVDSLPVAGGVPQGSPRPGRPRTNREDLNSNDEAALPQASDGLEDAMRKAQQKPPVVQGIPTAPANGTVADRVSEPAMPDRASRRSSRSEKSRRSSLFSSLTMQDLHEASANTGGGDSAAQQSTTNGWTKKPDDEAYVEAVLNGLSSSDPNGGPKPAHLGETKSERLKLVLQQFPRHLLHTNINCILPILIGIVPIFFGALHSRQMVSSLPDLNATYADYELLEFARPMSSAALQVRGPNPP